MRVAQTMDRRRLTPDVLRRFAEAVHASGAALDNCIGFIDGTVRAVARPSRHQRMVYNGHKRKHAVKFQAVTTPDGLIVHLHGPHEGKVHDATMLNRSGLREVLSEVAVDGERSYVIYGDPAYGLAEHIITPFRGAMITPQQEAFNASMSQARVSVEWGFGKVVGLFAFLDFAKNLKLHLQPVAMYYTVAVLLTNCHTCLYGSQTASFFNTTPPELQSYLANLLDPIPSP